MVVSNVEAPKQMQGTLMLALLHANALVSIDSFYTVYLNLNGL
jgi:hypothetical protein